MGGLIPAILGILVFGAMLVFLLRARGEVHRRMDDARTRTMPRDAADRGHERAAR